MKEPYVSSFATSAFSSILVATNILSVWIPSGAIDSPITQYSSLSLMSSQYNNQREESTSLIFVGRTVPARPAFTNLKLFNNAINKLQIGSYISLKPVNQNGFTKIRFFSQNSKYIMNFARKNGSKSIYLIDISLLFDILDIIYLIFHNLYDTPIPMNGEKPCLLHPTPPIRPTLTRGEGITDVSLMVTVLLYTDILSRATS